MVIYSTLVPGYLSNQHTTTSFNMPQPYREVSSLQAKQYLIIRYRNVYVPDGLLSKQCPYVLLIHKKLIRLCVPSQKL